MSGGDDISADERALIFSFFNEIGIIQQLSSTMLNRRLPDGLHVSHFGVLNHLSRRPNGETPLQLASAFQVTKGTMTHTVNVLHERGLIVLRPHRTDRRSKVVTITRLGVDFVHQAIASLGPSMARLSTMIDTERLAEILPELETIRILLDDNRDI
ncbi:MAG: MarR family transcriptional regulator [Ahrensia sp.]|nr:MarR family transcriptional regulator [Ahrensia sp.]